MERILRNALLFAFVLTSVPTFGTVAILISLFERKKVISHLVARLWCKLVLLISGVKVEAEGLENLEKGRPYVFFANHQSQMDIPVLEEVLKDFNIRFLAKKSLFKIPFFGWGIRALGYIPVEREDPREGLKSLVACAERIKEGYSVVVFPEGTRSPDGRLLPFKAAGFLLPIKAGVEAVPVAICGTVRVLPRGSVFVRPGKVKVFVGRPLKPSKTGAKGREELLKATRDFIESSLRRVP